MDNTIDLQKPLKDLFGNFFQSELFNEIMTGFLLGGIFILLILLFLKFYVFTENVKNQKLLETKWIRFLMTLGFFYLFIEITVLLNYFYDFMTNLIGADYFFLIMLCFFGVLSWKAYKLLCYGGNNMMEDIKKGEK